MKDAATVTTGEILMHAVILFMIATISHFAYDLSGENMIVGLFNPVNESVWEHLKLMFFPLLFWWIVMYRMNPTKGEMSPSNYMAAAAVSLIAAPLAVVVLYYSYTGALGIESVIIDLILVFICYFIALCLASHVLEYSEPDRCMVVISIAAIAIIFIAFIVFTFNPPQLPIFYDTTANTYGIPK